MRKLTLRHTPLRHFTQEQRRILESLWNVNAKRGRDTRLSIRAFARESGLPYATLRRELLRGMEGAPLYDAVKGGWFYPEYSADRAQAAADDAAAQKGAGMRFTNRTAEALRHQILALRKSPAHARHDLIAQGFDVPSVSSIYNHIEHGDIGILRGQTPYRPGAGRKRRPPPRRARKCPGNLSIEDRPPAANDRTEFGHWEMDTVPSCVGGKGGLLVLTERMTRLSLITRLKRVTAKAVRHAVRGILRSGRLKAVRSITTDNGCGSLDSEGLARLFRGISADLRIYYTHAYAAWEKGGVENVNRHIRRFYPKGTDFSRVPAGDIAATQDFINSIPRYRSLKGKTAHEAFNEAA